MNEYADLKIPAFKSESYARAQHLLHKAKYDPESLIEKGNGSKGQSLFDKLRDIYITSRKNNHTGFMDCSLLKKLVQKENLNYLVISLYDIATGYTFSLKNPYVERFVCHKSYEDSSILDFIDNEEIPYDFLDLLMEYPHNLFYDGYCIAEIRDFKGSINKYPVRSSFLLLKPTNQTIMGDVRMLTFGNNWTKEEELDVEAQLLLENSGPLCLDPDVAVSIITNSIEYYKNPFASQSLRTLAKIRRKFALKQISHKKYLAPVETKLLDFIEENELPSVGKEISLKDDVFKYENPPLIESVPHSIAPYLKRRILKVVGDSNSVFSLRPIEVEEFVFEYETLKDGDVQIMRDKLVITQTPHDGFYHGILHPCEKAHSRNSKNFFCLGSRSNLDLYICQLTRTLSDSFSRYIKVLHRGLESSSAKMNGEDIEGRIVFTAGIKLSEDSEDDSQIMDMSVDNEQISMQPSHPINVNPSGSTEVEYSSNPNYFASSESTVVEDTTDEEDHSPNDVVSAPSANEMPVFLHRPYQMSYYSDSNNDGLEQRESEDSKDMFEAATSLINLSSSYTLSNNIP